MEQLRARWEPARGTNRWAHGDGTTRLPFPAAQHDAAHQVPKRGALMGYKLTLTPAPAPPQEQTNPGPSYGAYYTHNLRPLRFFCRKEGFSLLFNTLTLCGAYREASLLPFHLASGIIRVCLDLAGLF